MRFLPAGLSLFTKTSSKTTFNIASWHSPHSLTWSWILSLRRHNVMWPKPYGRISRGHFAGACAGFGQLIGLSAYRDNGGWQIGVSLLWHELHRSRQRPMWYRDIARRQCDEEDEMRAENRALRRQITQIVTAPQSQHIH